MLGRRKKVLTRSEKLRLRAAYAKGQVVPSMSKAAGVTKTAADIAAARAAEVARIAAEVAAAKSVEAAHVAAERLQPHYERARDYAAPRINALAGTASVAVAPRLETARKRSTAALDVLRGSQPVVVEVREKRRWPVALLALLAGVAVGVVTDQRRKAALAREAVLPPEGAIVIGEGTVPTLVPDENEVVVLTDVRATSETNTEMPDRVNGE